MQEDRSPVERQEPIQQGPRRQQWEAKSHQLQPLHAAAQSKNLGLDLA